MQPLADADLALVRVCTCPASELTRAWDRWLLTSGADADDNSFPAHWRELLPLVALLQREHGLAGPGWLLSRLRTAAVLEGRRLEAVRHTTAEVLRVPAIVAVRPLVIGGLGIGETVYPDPASRHTGILSLMVAAGTGLPGLARETAAEGFRVRLAGRRARYWPFLPWARVCLVHPSGFQIVLFSAPLWRKARRLGHEQLLRNARQVHCPDGTRFMTPSIEDSALLLAAGIGREHNSRSLLPAVDAALLQRSLEAGHSAVVSDRRATDEDAAWRTRPT